MDHVREPFSLGHYVLVAADICGGSETVSMVSQVLKWRKTGQPLSEAQRAELQQAIDAGDDEKVVRLLDTDGLWEDLGQLNEVLFKQIASSPPAVISETFSKIRRRLREMGNRAGVPIEPASQTELCDATQNMLPDGGVLFSGVPGAGGHDAIFAVCKDEASAEKVQRRWVELDGIWPLMLREDPRGLVLENKSS
jgi:phosphomevalonate kinase